MPECGLHDHSMEFKLINDDCLNVYKEIPDNSIDFVLTDPPYNLGRFMKSRNAGIFRMRDNHFVKSGWDDLGYDEWHSQMATFFDESFRVLKDRGTLIIFMSLIKIETIIDLATKAGFYYKTVGTWHKKNPMPRNMKLTFVNSTEAWVYFVKNSATGTFNNGGLAIHDFVETSLTPMSEKRHGKHPTQKPVQLLSHFIQILSNPGDCIFDPFMGSGTTGVAALSLNRSFIGCELNEHYYNLSRSRILELKSK